MTPVLDESRRLAPGRNRARRRLPLALLALLALACGDDRAVDPPAPTPVASVAVSPEAAHLPVGESAPLAAHALAADGEALEDRPIAWTAAPAGVATVSAAGVVTAVAPGTATVTATIGGRAGRATIVVHAPGDEPGGDPPPARPTLAAIAPTQMTDGHDAGFTLTVTGTAFAPGAVVAFGGAPLETTWVSATTLRARVTPAELERVGEFAIRVINPPLAAELWSEPATFTVVPRIPTVVRIGSASGYPWTWTGERLPLAAEALDLAGRPLPHRVPLWSSDREDVAAVSAAGVVVGHAPGVASIAATVDGVADRMPVRVHAAPALGMVWTRGAGAARRLALWYPGRGEQPVPIHTPFTAYDPAPSPDGRHVAFTGVGPDGNVDVYVLTLGGGPLRRLTSADAVDDSPAWSPDGARIAFRSTRAGRSDVWVADADGANPRRLTDEAGTAAGAGSGDPAWSPDGSHLAYVHGPAADRDVWIMRADGSGKRRFTRDAADEREPAWSADGTVIAYREGTGDAARLVGRLVADGGDPFFPVAPLGAGATPAFAPEGGWLAFARATGHGHALHVVRFGSGEGARAVLPVDLDAGAQVAWLRP